MAGPGPWSVKGVDQTTRAIARAAAQRADLPIGVWLDRAILKTATIAVGAPAAADIPAETDPPVPGRGGATLEVVQESASREQALPAAAASVGIEPARPAGSPLDIPPPAEERTGSAADSLPSHRKRRALRYGIGGLIAVVAIGIGVATIDNRGAVKPTVPPPQAAASDTAAETPTTTPAVAPAVPPPAARAEIVPAAVVRTGPAIERTKEPELGKGPLGPAMPLEALSARAEAGDADAQYELGLRYSAGWTVPKDGRLAAKWFEKAAVQGLAAAQYNLGVLFERGMGVPKDAGKAFFWYQNAAEQNYARAEHNLATLYATGSGVSQNYPEAEKWFTRAADAGVPESLYSLGLMYEHGLGVARDIARAQAYYRRAAAAGSADAKSKLAAFAKDGLPPAEAAPPAAGSGAARNRATAERAAAPGSGRPLDRRGTAELQRLLARLDFAPGSSDGVAGRRTVAAIELYQQFAGLPVDGKPTVGLLDDVRVVSRSLGQPPGQARR